VRDVEAFADVAHRLARTAALDPFRLLVRGELRLAPHLHAPRLKKIGNGNAVARRGAADKRFAGSARVLTSAMSRSALFVFPKEPYFSHTPA
jgi:hypothetical protein